MELLKLEEIVEIVQNYGPHQVIDWTVEDLSEKVVGYLGEHLKLTINLTREGKASQLKLFIKCLPRFDKWKANYIRELTFFNKEYVMLSKLFPHFGGDVGPNKWRPKALLLKEELFVLEDLTELGYVMPNHVNTLNYHQVSAVVKSLAKFHAQSYIYEEKQSVKLNRKYRIWQDFSHSLQEPNRCQVWRDVGMHAVIDFIKVFSKYKSTPDFDRKVAAAVTHIFDLGLQITKPNMNYRNVVVHRDLWTNNIFLKQDGEKYHAVLVDFQTVFYSYPMLDLSSMLYFNTTRQFRDSHLENLIDIYYKVLSQTCSEEKIQIEQIIDKNYLFSNYKKAIAFGITQGALIVPIIAMTNDKRQKLFCDPVSCEKINEFSRSEELINVANEDKRYKQRVMDLFEEIVECFVLSDNLFKEQI